MIGGHALEGVPTGTGSSAVVPVGGYAAVIKIGGPGSGRNLYLLPSSPVAELKKLLPKAQIDFDSGGVRRKRPYWRGDQMSSSSSAFGRRAKASISRT